MKLEDLTYEQCVMQGVGPLVFPRRLEKSRAESGESRVETHERLQMKAVCMQNMQMQAKMQIVLSRAWKALTEAGIQPVLMKGLGLAQYYPEPSMRQWGDIDLFVGKEQYHPACAVMRETFPDALKFDEELDHYKHYNLIADGVSIEIHRVSVALTHPRDVRRYERMERFGMAHAIPLKYINTDTHADGAINIDKEEIKNEIVVPEVTFNVLMVFLHSWEHMLSGGANIRQLCDLALMLHHERERIDRVRLKRWLRELRLTEPWQLYMWILKEYLGLEDDKILDFRLQIADCRLEKKAEALMQTILGTYINIEKPASPDKQKNAESTAANGDLRVTTNPSARKQAFGQNDCESRTAGTGTQFPQDSLQKCTTAYENNKNRKHTNRFVRKWRTMKTRMANAERIAQFSPAYARHMKAAVWLSGLTRLFAPDRRWE